MTTIAECLSRAKQLEAVSDSARLDIELLLAKTLEKPRAFLYTWPEKELSIKEQERFVKFFERRMKGEPVAYILGEREFWSLGLKASPDALIPRPETELIVETVLQLLPTTKQTVLDLGTGTGAIAIAMAVERPNWQILAIDNYVAAINLAIENCQKYGLTNIAVNRSDWFSNVREKNFNAIVCNPPYIDEADKHLLHGDVRFEPRSALVAENSGLADLQQVISLAPNYLGNEGWLLVEHGWQQGESVRDLFNSNHFSHVETKLDLAGNERMTLGQKLEIHHE